MRVKLFLISEQLFSLELHHLLFLVDLVLNAMAAIIVLTSYGFNLLHLQLADLAFQVFEIGKDILEV